MTAYCPDCLVLEVPPNARDGRCSRRRPSRRHSKRKPHQPVGRRIPVSDPLDYLFAGLDDR